MDCLSCKSKGCKKCGADCFSLHDISVSGYSSNEVRATAKAASMLTDNGRAGTLSRIEEVVEFCNYRKFINVGIAYCFGVEGAASKVRDILVKAGINVVPARCTMGGVKECEVDPQKTNNTISCNPIGQASFLNNRSDFVIEMGLCLGHDILFHKQLTVPFTVLLVKDRVNQHNPLIGIENYDKEA